MVDFALSDVQWLLVVVAVLYAIEMAVWVRRGSFAVRSRLGRFSLQHRPTPLSNDSGRLIFSGPTPWDVTFLVAPPPLSIDGERLVNHTTAAPLVRHRPAVSPLHLDANRAHDIVSESLHLRCDGSLVATLPHGQSVQRWIDLLSDYATAEPNRRLALIDALIDEAFSQDLADERYRQWRAATRWLRRLGATMFVWIFGVGLAANLLYNPGEKLLLFVAGYFAVLLTLWWTIAGSTYVAHRKLYPRRRSDRFKQVFSAVVSPGAAMRSADHLGRQLFDRQHPLTAIAAVAGPEKVVAVAAAFWRDAVHPLPLTEIDDAASRATLASFHERYLAGMRRWLLERGLDPSQLLSPPSSLDEDTVAFCRRCLQEFADANATCEQCGGLPLEPSLR